MNGLLDFLQAASNTAASTVSGPVDLIGMGLRKIGVPVPQNALMSSEWMKQNGLMQDVPQSAASLAGETFGLLSPVVAAAKAPQIAGGLLKMGENAAAPRTLNPQTGAIVWHGSPHKFDKFDSSKIGTGEGAQAYGHGLYLAEAQDVAASYVPKSGAPSWKGKPVSSYGMDGSVQFADGTAGKVADAEWGAFRKAMESGPRTGNLYKVDLPDSAIARMLDWDKPLSQQAPGVQKAVESVMEKRAAAAEAQRLAMNAQYPARTTHPVLSKIANKPRAAFDYKGEAAVTELVKELGGPDKAAQFFRAQGIPGIRYLDGGSRGAGSGTSNFVVFPGEENLLRILERNGKPL